MKAFTGARHPLSRGPSTILLPELSQSVMFRNISPGQRGCDSHVTTRHTPTVTPPLYRGVMGVTLRFISMKENPCGG